MLGQVVNHLDARQLSRQRFTLATALDWGNDFFIRIVNHRQQRFAFRLVEHRQLRRVGIDGLLGFAIEQSIMQQRDLFFQIDDMPLVDRTLDHLLRKQLLEQDRVIRKVIGQWNHGPDYTGSGNETGCQNLMRTVAPEVETIQYPVQFLHRQYDGLVRFIR